MSRPSEAPYTAAASPAGPAPTTATSNTCPAGVRKARPRWAARSAGVGRRKVAVGVTTTGTSLRRTPMPARRTSTSSIVGSSRSVHSWARRWRRAKERSANDDDEKREPTMRSVPAPAPALSASRRATKAAKITSASVASDARSSRKRSGPMRTTRESTSARAASVVRCPVSRFNSPRNRPRPWRAMRVSWPSWRRMTENWPSMTATKSGSSSPASNTSSPAATVSTRPKALSRSNCSAVSAGNAAPSGATSSSTVVLRGSGV